MKRTVLILITFLLLLITGCSSTPEPSAPPQNLHPENRNQANLRENFVETADGCYYLNQGDPYNSFIYFSPRGSTSFYPLCNKPNCSHHDNNCNAWCRSAFGYYNGALYAVSQNMENARLELIKMDLDGSNHETVAPLPLQSGALQMNFHHGKLYIYSWGDYAPIDPELDRFFVMDLDTYESTELFVDFFQAGNRLGILGFLGDKMYGYVSNIASDQARHIAEYDTTSGTWRELVPLDLGSVYATETTLFYLEPDAGFRELDLATGEIKDCAPAEKDAWWAAYDDNYIYVMSRGRNNDADHTLYFYSRDYQLLDQVELTNDLFYGYVSSEKLYFSTGIEPLTYYINKSDIGSHKLLLQPLNAD